MSAVPWTPPSYTESRRRLPDGSNALTVRDLTVSFRQRADDVAIVHGVDLTLKAGRTLVLLGESGSGKSVTARAIMRLLGRSAVIGGSVMQDKTELTTLSERMMRSVRGGLIGLVSQDPSGSLDPLRRIGDQMVETLLRHGIEADRRAARGNAASLLERVGLREPDRVMRSLPFELSGGMRQRVAIALALGCGPEVLIADEPTTALDVTIQAQVLDLFEQVKTELGVAILLVTHDVGVARVIGDEVAVMYAGRLVETGTVNQVLDDPQHPYTQALLGALPVPGVARGRLQSIPGQPPAPSELPWAGACAFAPRCARAVAACTAHEPLLAPVGPGHASACDLDADTSAPGAGADAGSQRQPVNAVLAEVNE